MFEVLVRSWIWHVTSCGPTGGGKWSQQTQRSILTWEVHSSGIDWDSHRYCERRLVMCLVHLLCSNPGSIPEDFFEQEATLTKNIEVRDHELKFVYWKFWKHNFFQNSQVLIFRISKKSIKLFHNRTKKLANRPKGKRQTDCSAKRQTDCKRWFAFINAALMAWIRTRLASSLCFHLTILLILASVSSAPLQWYDFNLLVWFRSAICSLAIMMQSSPWPPQQSYRWQQHRHENIAHGKIYRVILSLLLIREALPPSGFTPTPSSSAAGCILDTMNQVQHSHCSSIAPRGLVHPSLKVSTGQYSSSRVLSASLGV